MHASRHIGGDSAVCSSMVLLRYGSAYEGRRRSFTCLGGALVLIFVMLCASIGPWILNALIFAGELAATASPRQSSPSGAYMYI